MILVDSGGVPLLMLIVHQVDVNTAPLALDAPDEGVVNGGREVGEGVGGAFRIEAHDVAETVFHPVCNHVFSIGVGREVHLGAKAGSNLKEASAYLLWNPWGRLSSLSGRKDRLTILNQRCIEHFVVDIVSRGVLLPDSSMLLWW